LQTEQQMPFMRRASWNFLTGLACDVTTFA
jgi:hypothetical protein